MIQKRIEELAVRHTDLHELLETLHEKLGPVLLAEQPVPAGNDPAVSESHCRIEEQIDTVDGSVVTACRKVESILNRLRV